MKKKEQMLHDKLKQYESNLRFNPEDDEAYHMKAKTLVELGALDNNAKGYFQDALKNYNKAIELTNNKEEPNPEYLVDRSKLYTKLDDYDLAINDIKEAKNIGTTGDWLTDKYVTVVVNDVLRMQNVQAKISALRERKEISQEFADALEEHAAITTGLVVKVGDHDERIINIEGIISQGVFTIEMYNSLVQANADLKQQLLEHKEAIIINGKSISRVEKQTEQIKTIIKPQETVGIVKEIIFNNKILNYPDLLRETIKRFGIEKVGELSASLDSVLIEEAITNNNSELIEAGFMSLLGKMYI